MDKLLFVLILFLALSFAATAQSQTKIVKKQNLISKEMPAVQLKFGKNFKYAGGHSFVLYDVANAEQHFFVDTDKQGRVKRMYWIQFEGYLPNNTHSYDYKSPKTVNIGGLDFFADAYARNIKADPGRPDSDGSRARAFLESKGFRLGSDELIMQRLVHLIDKEKRNELMIIYLEDMSSLGVTSADVAAGGKAAAKWNDVADALLARALKDLKITRQP
jgi:hypothetical protein